MSAVAGPRPRSASAPPRYFLNPFWRRVVILVHIISGIAWMGIDIALFALLLTGSRTSDGLVALACYRAISVIVPPAVPILSLTMLGSGLLLGWGTKWGVLRYWWVIAKLVIALVMVALVFLSLTPGVAEIPARLGPAVVTDADAVRAALGGAATQLFYPPIVSFSMLGIAAILSQFKPWPRTPWTPARTR